MNNETTMIYQEGLHNPGGTPGTPQGPNPLLQYQVNILCGLAQCSVQKHEKIHLGCFHTVFFFFLQKHVKKLCISHYESSRY